MLDFHGGGFSPVIDARPPQMEAASVLPTPPAPKVKNVQQTLPSFLRTAKPNPKNAFQIDDRRLANTDITTFRTGSTTRDTIRSFVRASPDLSAAVTSYVRTGITSGYTAVARNADGTVNPEATSTLAQLITRINILKDYSLGYDDSMSIRSLSETWAWQLLQTGAMAGELVLDKARLPDKLQPVAVSQIKLYPSPDGKKLMPKQAVPGGTEIDLNIPTFFMVSLDQDVLTPYADSPIEPALQAVLFSAEFMNDIRRVVKKAIHPRVVVTIDEEKFRKTVPPEVAGDQEKLLAFMQQTIEDIQNRVSGLAPEDAIVVFSTFGVEVLDHGNTNLSNEYTVLQGLADAKLRAGAKTMPTVVGQSNGTSNVASSETMMFLKYVEGTVWGKLNEMFSKMLTLAVRLLGQDVYVEFAFNAIELRPKSELESFYALKQSRILELLSLGFLSDEQAAIELTGQLPPAGFKALSGTGFFQMKAAAPTGDGFNGASSTSGTSTLNQQQKSDQPSGGARGQNKKAEVVPIGVAL